MKKIRKIFLISLLIIFVTTTYTKPLIFYNTNFLAEDSTKEEQMEVLEKKIKKESTTIKKNETEILALEEKIKTDEKKVNYTVKVIKELESKINKREELINTYLVFLQRLNNKNIMLEQIKKGDILEYLYSFKKLVKYINKDFERLNLDVQNLNSKKEQYKVSLAELSKQKVKLEKDNKTTDKMYKKLNEELKELEKEVEYEVEYSDDTYILDNDQKALMSSVGISEEDYSHVNYIIFHESSWNYKVSNPYSGAYGLCQALPGDKMAVAGDDWKTNPKTQLIWCDGYAKYRYGSWAAAHDFWIENNWW